jgi:beta-galactosidase
MHAFGGRLTAIVQAGETAGTISFEARSKGVKAATCTIAVSATD